MYGAIYGDLVGSIYEFSQLVKVKNIKTDKLLKEDSFFSDDTILTIAILDAALNNKDYDYYLKKYIKMYKDYKPNYKPYFSQPFSPSLIQWSNLNNIGTSRGNGAIMRISPIGFVFNSEEEVAENARLATISSHNSKEAIECATIISLMIYYFRMGYTKDEVYNKMNLDIKYIPFTKFNTMCEITLNNCLYQLFNSVNFEDSIRKTLYMGGDTDTNCAIVGGLAEALYGINNSIVKQVNEKIPYDFVKVLNRYYN